MKTLLMSLFLLSFNACAASSGGGWVVGNPVMPETESKEAAKLLDIKDCECKDSKKIPPCECKKEEEKKKEGDTKDAGVKPVVKPSKKKGK